MTIPVEPMTPAAAPEAAAGSEEYTEVRHSMTRRTIARRLTESKQLVPHFYLKASCCIDPLLALRSNHNRGAEVRISVNDLIVRAVALALKATPDANVAWGEKSLKCFVNVDVAIAVATPRGLITPIVRKADLKSVAEISVEGRELAARGREGKLTPEEWDGGNVTVSNLGMFGVEEFTAILNPPQSTIFAVGAGEPRAVVRDGKVEVATMMTVTVSVDHRAVDGAVAARLLSTFKDLIENPAPLLA